MRFKVLMLVLAFLVALPMAAHANFLEGKKSYDNKNWRRAILHLRPLVEQGDARAMVLMGNMYAEGHGVEKDTTEAFTLYYRAAERNNTDGMLATATLYQTGDGVPANTRLAIMWFERGAQLGHQTSAFFYAMHLYQGSKGATFDFKPDHVAAYKWFRIAARSRGNPKLAKTADTIAEKLRTELHYNDVEAADRAVVEWVPTEPRNLGPLPEAALAAEREANGDVAAPQETPPEEKPAEGEKSGTEKPAPEAKPAE